MMRSRYGQRRAQGHRSVGAAPDPFGMHASAVTGGEPVRQPSGQTASVDPGLSAMVLPSARKMRPQVSRWKQAQSRRWFTGSAVG